MTITANQFYDILFNPNLHIVEQHIQTKDTHTTNLVVNGKLAYRRVIKAGSTEFMKV